VIGFVGKLAWQHEQHFVHCAQRRVRQCQMCHCEGIKGSGHRGVVEHRLQPAVAGADDAVQLDVDLAFEVRQEVRKLVLRGDQVDRALQLLLQQRAARFGVPVDRVFRPNMTCSNSNPGPRAQLGEHCWEGEPTPGAFCISFAVRLEGRMTCMYVRLLGPCFKTGGKPGSSTPRRQGR